MLIRNNFELFDILGFCPIFALIGLIDNIENKIKFNKNTRVNQRYTISFSIELSIAVIARKNYVSTSYYTYFNE